MPRPTAFPTATREDHDDICTTEGRTLRRGARGKPVQHHRSYELGLPDGRVLRTRVSKPIDRSDYRASMWSHILREQLEVDAAEFWECVRDRVVPDRGAPAEERPGLPYFLLDQLVSRVGLSPEDAVRLTPLEAEERIAQHWRDVARGS